jgi:hypothetical protein
MDLGALEWTSFISALIGGGLTLLGTLASGRLDRRARRDELKEDFQRHTLLDIQDALEALIRVTRWLDRWRSAEEDWQAEITMEWQSIPEERRPPWNPPRFDEVGHQRSFNESGNWEALQETKIRLEKLVVRIDNEQVRMDVRWMVRRADNVLHNSSILGEIEDRYSSVNQLIGTLLRGDTRSAKNSTPGTETAMKTQ